MNIREHMYEMQCSKCFYCQERFELAEMVLDHFWPFCKGGQNGHRNRVLACKPCDQEKRDRLPTAEEQARMIDMKPWHHEIRAWLPAGGEEIVKYSSPSNATLADFWPTPPEQGRRP